MAQSDITLLFLRLKYASLVSQAAWTRAQRCMDDIIFHLQKKKRGLSPVHGLWQ